MIKLLIPFFFLFVSFSSVYSQLKMGGWRTHFSYNNVEEITQSKDKVYAISNGALFSVDKEYESLDTYSKVNGLNDGNISHIAYDEGNNILLIAYSNCNIDILEGDNAIFNISDLKRKEIVSKQINHISFYKQYAYLSCGFGIVVVNLKKKEISDTYIIGREGTYLSVNSVQVANGHLYALTGNGIYYADIQNENLANFENWKILSDPDNTSLNKEIITFCDNLILQKENAVYRYDGSTWQILRKDAYFTNLYSTGNNLILFQNESFLRFDADWKEQEYQVLSGISDLVFSSKENCYWLAYNQTNQVVLTKYKNGEVLDQFIPEGPYSSSVAFVKYKYGKLLTGSGGPFDMSDPTKGIVQVYEDGKWTIIRRENISSDIISEDVQFKNILDAIVDPVDPRRMYVATWQESVFEFYDNKLVKHYTTDNSSLEKLSSNPSKFAILTDGFCFDDDNNLWMTNMLSGNLLKVKKEDGTWGSFYYSDIANRETAKELFISSNGYKWILFPRAGSKLFVINDNKTPFVRNDDKTKEITSFKEVSSTKAITPSTYRCIAEDKNNAIWIGTDVGPLIISNASNIFSDDFIIERIKITREDDNTLADYLLAKERINAIAVDGGNRKWIATESSGVYLLSASGQETIHHFTTENSPLTSDNIVDLAINDETGEVVIATSTSLFTYQSDATEGTDSYNNVYAYPNPVKENYTGLITIKGLMEKSVVKIADIQGNLIWQGNSNGGMFTWNGQNKDGKRVSTGVYLVFAALDDGSEKIVTKIAIIN